MSKWPMRGHFRYLRFKTFPMTPRTPQCEVFCLLLSSSEKFGSPRGLQILTFSKCWASPPHLAKVGLRQAWPHRHPVFWSVIIACSSTTLIWNKNLERRKPEQFLPDLEFQSLIQLTMGLPHRSVQLDPDCSHKRMWDFLIKIRNLCPQQTNIPWVGYLCILPLTAWQSTKAVPFLKPITDAAANNISASSKAS